MEGDCSCVMILLNKLEYKLLPDGLEYFGRGLFIIFLVTYGNSYLYSIVYSLLSSVRSIYLETLIELASVVFSTLKLSITLKTFNMFHPSSTSSNFFVGALLN